MGGDDEGGVEDEEEDEEEEVGRGKRSLPQEGFCREWAPKCRADPKQREIPSQILPRLFNFGPDPPLVLSSVVPCIVTLFL